MFLDKTILAVVPARSGSKGIANKNMHTIKGISLIGKAGQCLSKLSWIDVKIISTDSSEYAEEGKRYGLDVPFLRPAELSTDGAGAVETIRHALIESEKYYKKTFHIILIIEPTSPLREPEDITKTIELLIHSRADSVVTVSPLSPKSHPAKVFSIQDNRLTFYEERGKSVILRQSLDKLYWRNGICYTLTRDTLVEKKKIITKNTVPLIIDRYVVNIDEPIELDWLEFLTKKKTDTLK